MGLGYDEIRFGRCSIDSPVGLWLVPWARRPWFPARVSQPREAEVDNSTDPSEEPSMFEFKESREPTGELLSRSPSNWCPFSPFLLRLGGLNPTKIDTPEKLSTGGPSCA